jgi:hypothetical protein
VIRQRSPSHDVLLRPELVFDLLPDLAHTDSVEEALRDDEAVDYEWRRAVNLTSRGEERREAKRERERGRERGKGSRKRTSPTPHLLPAVRVLTERRSLDESPDVDEERTRSTRVLKLFLRSQQSLVVVPLDLVRSGVLAQILRPLEVVCYRAGRGGHANDVEIACEKRER